MAVPLKKCWLWLCAEQALAATQRLERSETQSLFFVIPVSSPVTTVEQSENVAIDLCAHLVGGVWPLQLLPSAHAHSTNGLCL